MSVIIRSATGPCQQMAPTSNGYPWQDGDILDAADLNAAFAAVYDNAAAAYNNVGRNLIHNPLFNIAQRGAGPYTGGFQYTLDRWCIANFNDTYSITQNILIDSARTSIGDEEAVYSLQNNFTGNAAAGSFSYLQQRIESVRRLANHTVTISFWAACASGALKLGVNMLQNFGTGGSPAAPVQALAVGATVTLSSTYTRFSVTLSVPSVIGKTFGTNPGSDYSVLQFFYSTSAGNAGAGNIGVQSGIIALWGVQLEIGTIATPLEKLGPRYDLSNCQRFYASPTFNYGGSITAGNVLAYSLSLPVTMRAAPTIFSQFTSQVNLSSPGVNAVDNTIMRVSATGIGTSAFNLTGAFTASADL